MAKISGARRCLSCAPVMCLPPLDLVDILKALRRLISIQSSSRVVLVLWTPSQTTGSRRSGRRDGGAAVCRRAAATFRSFTSAAATLKCRDFDIGRRRRRVSQMPSAVDFANVAPEFADRGELSDVTQDEDDDEDLTEFERLPGSTPTRKD